ncbi:uncharacterized protein MYCFIDRAFT_43995 [Pseudocercospora fijiensis CIRAD86]|uniref:Polyketide cyclase/dehydrase n=1 Tax=Pseudocercospora fijiensis (strain CIRAD86) TaxID=383855 RepID=M2ZXR2_PSEFD|nr:uncharacterized protein MYCFIDRAFT_43995 [Pseudocercospora fijiensis CIRAD86]EME76901.1 hypothetical protein MYCFIDRAFT_43995 [Pseudocercospora fijiensis CIRAD86]
MVLIHTQIEIAAPPEKVRDIFLDFPKLSEWHKGLFKAIEYAPGKTTADVGDKLKVIGEGMTFEPIVLENSPAKLEWRGSLPYIFTGIHSYQFRPSQKNPGHTTLVQEENFTGLLSPLMWTSFGSSTKAGFEKLNADLKAKVESS